MMLRLVLVLGALMFASGVQAEIYKCVAEDGGITYSQVPCPKQKTTTVRTTVTKIDDTVDCRWASQFANDVAQHMRSGLTSTELFDSHGGIDSVSSGTVNIINYVYRFRNNDSVPLQRISSLAGTMCEAGSLGDVRCEVLPYGQDTSTNRCAPDTEVAGDDCRGADCGETVAAQAQLQQPVPTAEYDRQNNEDTQARNDKVQEQCKKSYRDQIDAIDAQMRQGYDSAEGESYRERLRALTTSLRQC